MDELNLDSLVIKLLELPHQFMRRFELSMPEKLQNLELAMPQIMMLHMISTWPATPNMSDIARQLNVSNAMMTHVIDGLEKMNFVERTRDEKDRRAIQLSVTSKGLEILRIAGDHHKEQVKKFLLSLSTEDRQEFLKATDMIYKILQATKKEPK